MNFIALLLVLAPFADQENLTEHTLKTNKGAKAANADLSAFGFLQGEWSGTGFGAQCDEMWGAPSGECMLGTFRMVKDGKLVFTEFCMIQKDPDGGVVLRLKHFDSKLDGWEEKDQYVSFPLVKIEKNAAYFGGLTYALQPDGSLKIWVAMKQKDETYREEGFHLQSVTQKIR